MNFAFLLSALFQLLQGIPADMSRGAIVAPPPDTSGVITGARARQMDTSGVLTGAKTKPRMKAMDTSGVITG
jgi:hypothetical protein